MTKEEQFLSSSGCIPKEDGYEFGQQAGKDPINPNYYKLDGIESFDFQQAVCKRLPGNEAALVFNILKYMTRYKYKNGLIDLNKAKWYLDKLISEVEKG